MSRDLAYARRVAERGSAALGIGWIVWCALAFVVVLGGGSALFERVVVVPHCVEACRTERLGFERYRVGGRSGPSSACLCEGGRAIDTSIADEGMFCVAVGFLGACYAPFAIAGLRQRRRRRDADEGRG